MTLIRLTRPNETDVFVNPEAVSFVESKGEGRTTVHFSGGVACDVKGTPKDTADELRK